tara:strand:- start:39 stop:401 length:363 start_codon:yes stop_codon:yes gene_type:complete
MTITITATPIQNGIAVTGSSTTVTSNTLGISSTSAEALPISISGLTATNVSEAIAELAGDDFRQNTTPTGSQVSEGDTWYDTDANQLKLYRETSTGVFEWVPIMIGNNSPDSDTLDAGAF